MKRMADAREGFPGRWGYLFTCFGYVIGLGNIWRFPYNCYKNGGGAFLLPYLLAVAMIAMPLMALEAALGQFSSTGPVTVWKISPLFTGIGVAAMVNTVLVFVYYNVLIMYALYYILVSFVSIGGRLPWQQCDPADAWSTESCRTEPLPDIANLLTDAEKITASLTIKDDVCVENLMKAQSLTNPLSAYSNYSWFDDIFSQCDKVYHTPEEQYWNRFILEQDDDSSGDDLGPLVGRNVVLLFIVWLIIFFCCIRGIRSISKVIPLTVTFPFFILMVLLVRALTLPGNSKGVSYYIVPDWAKLRDMKVWSAATLQAMYTLGPCYGSHIALASLNNFNNNILRDAGIIAAVNTITSIVGGFAVFALIGHKAERINTPIEDVLVQGPGLLFVTYTEGMAELPGSPIWTCLFFVMIFTLGLDSQFVMVWTLCIALQDTFPILYSSMYRRLLLIGICVCSFLLGLPLATKGGIHLLVLMDHYNASFSIILLAILQCLVITWCYGLQKFIMDIEMMTGTRPLWFWLYWCFNWVVFIPLYSVFIFVGSAIGYSQPSYDGKQISAGLHALGWLMVLAPLCCVVAVGIYKARRFGGVRNSIKATNEWRPFLEENRTGRYRAENDYIVATELDVTTVNATMLATELDVTTVNATISRQESMQESMFP